MPLNIDITNATRNQATATYTLKKIFVFDNRYVEGDYKNNTDVDMTLQSGMLAARAAGSYETAAATFGTALTAGQTMIIAGLTYAAYYSTTSSVVFNATQLEAGETIIIEGLTYTSTGVTTRAQLAAAFANLADGATTGAGTGTGAYSGALTGFSTGTVASGSTVVFTSTDKTIANAATQTGTGAAATITSTNNGATTTAQLAAAFANLDSGATTGGGTATGSYSGTLTNYSTGAASGSSVTFTALTTGPKTDLVATGTGTTPTWVYVQGTASIANSFIPVTSSNLADVIGITAVDGSVALDGGETSFINICTKGTIDGNFLTLPSGVTLDTVVGAKILRDIIESLGIHVDTSSVEQTKAEV